MKKEEVDEKEAGFGPVLFLLALMYGIPFLVHFVF